MLQHLVYRYPLVAIHLDHLSQQIFQHKILVLFRKIKFTVQYFLVQHVEVFVKKRQLPILHYEDYYPQAPYICFVSDHSVVQYHLGRHIAGSALRVPYIFSLSHDVADAEVTDFGISVGVDEDVRQFQVSVDYVGFMDDLNLFYKLEDE